MNIATLSREDLEGILKHIFNASEVKFSDPDIRVTIKAEDDIESIRDYLSKK